MKMQDDSRIHRYDLGILLEAPAKKELFLEDTIYMDHVNLIVAV